MQEHLELLIPIITLPQFRKILAEVVSEEINKNHNYHTEPETEKLYTIREACKYLGLSKPTIYSLMKEGKLKSTYLGINRLRFQKQDLLAYINSGRK
ncbi:helix-turn-helix transcriptional regulator [Adhaeribacter rhizoryzae]|uniref:Helix-turn-helix domain-containing protein n=1 Tax=Adhaeribacter rhizoryzae TaxID=2607907 RepID=A0A5M6D800_9BACT|nr:helix-turn-helix domain-containing protein [Adhaeribacter rhizoryzae]